MTNTPPPIGTAEAARLLNVDRSTLSRWVAAGRIATVTQFPGRTGAMLFDPAEVQRVKEAMQESAA